MELLTRQDIHGKSEYETLRPGFRRKIIQLKGQRRVPVGEHCSVHFECRDTMHYQVQEMLRAEDSWSRPGALEDELKAYNPLIPRGGALSATIMFEYETAEERAEFLPQLVGIDQHLWLCVGNHEPLLADFDRGQIDERGVSSVQYIKWQLDAGRIQEMQVNGTVLRVRIDHPAYMAESVLAEGTRKELVRDLID